MSYLMIDDRNSGGKLSEMDCVHCKHCQALVALVIRGLTKGYSSPHSCSQCRGPICKACAKTMAANNGQCMGGFKRQIDRKLAENYRRLQNIRCGI